MRVMNLMIVLAVISVVILAAQYISQLRKNSNGNNYVSGGRVFLNWILAIVFVVSIVGIGFETFYGGNKQESKPAQENTEHVDYASSDDDLGDVTVKFDKKVTLDENGEAKVKFTVSPKTKLTIRGHKTQKDVKVFKASDKTKHSYTFDFAGTYDIIAQRGKQKVTKKLVIEDNDSMSSSSVSSVSSSSSSSSASSSSVSSSTTNNVNQSNSNATARSNANTGRSFYTGRNTGTNTGNSNEGSVEQKPAPAENNAPAY